MAEQDVLERPAAPDQPETLADQQPGRLNALLHKHWRKISAGVLVLAGVVGGALVVDSQLDDYFGERAEDREAERQQRETKLLDRLVVIDTDKPEATSLPETGPVAKNRTYVLAGGVQYRRQPVFSQEMLALGRYEEDYSNVEGEIGDGEVMVVTDPIEKGDWIGFRLAEDKPGGSLPDELAENLMWVNVAEVAEQSQDSQEPLVRSYKAPGHPQAEDKIVVVADKEGNLLGVNEVAALQADDNSDREPQYAAIGLRMPAEAADFLLASLEVLPEENPDN